MSLLSFLPIMPLYYEGKTKFSPIHVIDLVDIIYKVIESNKKNILLECVGPETFTFKEIIQILLKLIKKKRILIPLPLPLAKISAKILQLFPKPLLTEDQLKMLKYNNCANSENTNNFDLTFNFKSSGMAKIIKKDDNNLLDSNLYSYKKSVKS